MATYKLFFATTQHGRKCIKITDVQTPLSREEIVLLAKKLINEDATPISKGKLRRFLHAEQRVMQSIRLI